MQKKILITTIIFLMFNTVVLGYSSGFEYMLKTLNIEKQNINGNFINEEIYNKYNLIVYGSPSIITKNQRWKETTNGNWIKNEVAGEYWILRRKLFTEKKYIMKYFQMTITLAYPHSNGTM